jgi:hypothetical protein
MPKAQVNPFNENLLTEEAAEAEELTEGGAPQQEGVAPVQQETATEKPAEQAEATAEAPNKTGVVPYQRFQEVNERAKALERQVTELLPIKEQWARYDERRKILEKANEDAQRAAQQQQIAAQRPDEGIDPYGARQWDQEQKIAHLEQQLTQTVGQLQNFGQNYQQNQEGAQFSNWVQAEAQQYVAQDPEYMQKATFAANKRIEFWSGLGAPPDVARKMVEAESVLIARVAQQYGGRFAPLVAGLAQQWGYQSPNGQQAQPQNGGAQQRLAQVAAGQKVQGISRIPAAGPATQTVVRNMSAIDLANMSEAEFARIKANPQLRAELAYAMASAEGVEPEEMMGALKSA